MSYYSRKLALPFQHAVERVTISLQQQGFGVISATDLKDTFRKKLNVGFRNYKVIAACDPDYAYKALSLESHMGGNVHCNVVVQEHENGEIEVSATNPLDTLDAELQITSLRSLASDIGARLRKAVDNLQDHTPDAHEELSQSPEEGDEIILWPIQG